MNLSECNNESMRIISGVVKSASSNAMYALTHKRPIKKDLEQALIQLPNYIESPNLLKMQTGFIQKRNKNQEETGYTFLTSTNPTDNITTNYSLSLIKKKGTNPEICSP